MFFDPAQGWHRAGLSGRSVARTILLHLVPMLLLGCLAEGYGMVHWGKPVGDLGARKTYPLEQVVPLQAAHFVAAIVLVLVCAVMVRSLADTFQRRQNFAQALVVSVFGLGPVFLVRVADAFPVINPWLSWSVGALLMVALLYQGLPRVFHLDPAHALGVYMSCSMLMVLLAGLTRVVMVLLVQPRLLAVAGG